MYARSPTTGTLSPLQTGDNGRREPGIKIKERTILQGTKTNWDVVQNVLGKTCSVEMVPIRDPT